MTSAICRTWRNAYTPVLGMRTTLTAVCAALLLGVAAACGGDDDGGDGEFQSQVNAICADYGPKLALLTPPAVSNEEWAAIGADMGDLLEASVNELRLLQPPEDLSEDYAEWLAARTRILAAIRDAQVAGGSHDEQGLEESLAKANAAIAEADPLAEELGFADCSPTGVTTS